MANLSQFSGIEYRGYRLSYNRLSGVFEKFTMGPKTPPNISDLRMGKCECAQFCDQNAPSVNRIPQILVVLCLVEVAY